MRRTIVILVAALFALSVVGAAIAEESAEAEKAAAAGEKVKDPVCGMMVTVNDDAHHATHEGDDYYFCSAACKEKFEKEPGKYLKK
ncbi:YHS domain-containing protein [bacterium]|nr:YHS domain-containing protein [bacterium]